MSAFEVLGLACFDEKFRSDFFKDFEQAIAPFDKLTWAERDSLRKVSRAGAVEGAMKALGGEVMMAVGCPNPPDCPWPAAFTLNKPNRTKTAP